MTGTGTELAPYAQGPLILWCGDCSLFSSLLRVPALPVKNLNGTGPVHPALAGESQPTRMQEVRKRAHLLAS